MRALLVALVLLTGCTKPGPVILLGDSLISGIPPSEIAEGARNYAIRGMDSAGLLRTVGTYPELPRARLVILTIGTNDIGRGKVATMEPRLRAILAQIPGPLLWHAVPPTTKGDNRQANAIIRRLCAERADCTYMETPFQPGDFADGTHLTPQGYARWIESLRAALASSV
jgi:lysophospholipase L1-like esterase